MQLIILAGMPATGKSTAAKQLRAYFGYPVLEKDAIKECLFDTIGFSDYAGKRRLDTAANAVLLRLTEEMIACGQSLIVDNNFDEESAAKLAKIIQKSAARAVTVFFDGDPQVLYERYIERDEAFRRHPGHALQDHYPLREGEERSFSMTREGFDSRFLNRKMNRMSWGGRKIMLDATWPEQTDIPALIRKIESALAEEGGAHCETK